jgi:hypothetical protein
MPTPEAHTQSHLLLAGLYIFLLLGYTLASWIKYIVSRVLRNQYGSGLPSDNTQLNQRLKSAQTQAHTGGPYE